MSVTWMVPACLALRRDRDADAGVAERHGSQPEDDGVGQKQRVVRGKTVQSWRSGFESDPAGQVPATQKQKGRDGGPLIQRGA